MKRGKGTLEHDSILGTVIRNDHVTLYILAPVSPAPQTFRSLRLLYSMVKSEKGKEETLIDRFLANILKQRN